jgi:hypothetical protein
MANAAAIRAYRTEKKRHQDCPLCQALVRQTWMKLPM